MVSLPRTSRACAPHVVLLLLLFLFLLLLGVAFAEPSAKVEAPPSPSDGGPASDPRVAARQDEALRAAAKRRYEEKAEAALRAGKADYGSVKEDFTCRACVALTSTFVNSVLRSAEARYARVREGGAQAARKESMVAEIHESIDGLCAAVKEMHAEEAAREAKEEERKSAAGGAQKGGSVPTVLAGDRSNIRTGIEIACPHTLEQLNDAFAESAFKLLMPTRFPAGDDTTGQARDGQGAKDSPATEASSPYVLPKAGAFCEEQKLCSPYLHYHITSEESVAARQRAGRARERAARAGTGHRGAAVSGAYNEEDRLRDDALLRERRARAGRTGTAGATNGVGESYRGLVDLLLHPGELFAVTVGELRHGDVISTAFWRKLLRYLGSDALWFHLGPQSYYLVMAAGVILVVAMTMTAVLLWCCGCSTSATGSRRNVLEGSTVVSPPSLVSAVPAGKKQS